MKLSIYTLYYNTVEFPEEYILREWTISSGKQEMGPVVGQGKIRAEVCGGVEHLEFFARNEYDDPSILGSFL